MTVNLEGVKDAEKIVVDVVDGTDFELVVDGLYRCRNSQPSLCWSIFVLFVGHLVVDTTFSLATQPPLVFCPASHVVRMAASK